MGLKESIGTRKVSSIYQVTRICLHQVYSQLAVYLFFKELIHKHIKPAHPLIKSIIYFIGGSGA